MSELKAGAEGRSERARAGLQPSPRRQHRRRLPASGPRHFGGFGARGPRQGPHGGSAAGGPGRAAGPRAGSGRHSAEPHQRQSLHLVSAGPPRGAAGAGRRPAGTDRPGSHVSAGAGRPRERLGGLWALPERAEDVALHLASGSAPSPSLGRAFRGTWSGWEMHAVGAVRPVPVASWRQWEVARRTR